MCVALSASDAAATEKPEGSTSAPAKTASETEAPAEAAAAAEPAVVLSLGTTRLRASHVRSPSELRDGETDRGDVEAPRRFVLLDEAELDLPDDPVDPIELALSSARAVVLWPEGPRVGTPRLQAEVGVATHSVAFGVFTLYAEGTAEVSADATPDDDGRGLAMSGRGRFAVGAHATDTLELGIEVTRRGPATFDLFGDEARGLASLRFGF